MQISCQATLNNSSWRNETLAFSMICEDITTLQPDVCYVNFGTNKCTNGQLDSLPNLTGNSNRKTSGLPEKTNSRTFKTVPLNDIQNIIMIFLISGHIRSAQKGRDRQWTHASNDNLPWYNQTDCEGRSVPRPPWYQMVGHETGQCFTRYRTCVSKDTFWKKRSEYPDHLMLLSKNKEPLCNNLQLPTCISQAKKNMYSNSIDTQNVQLEYISIDTNKNR